MIDASEIGNGKQKKNAVKIDKMCGRLVHLWWA